MAADRGVPLLRAGGVDDHKRCSRDRGSGCPTLMTLTFARDLPCRVVAGRLSLRERLRSVSSLRPVTKPGHVEGVVYDDKHINPDGHCYTACSRGYVITSSLSPSMIRSRALVIDSELM